MFYPLNYGDGDSLFEKNTQAFNIQGSIHWHDTPSLRHEQPVQSVPTVSRLPACENVLLQVVNLDQADADPAGFAGKNCGELARGQRGEDTGFFRIRQTKTVGGEIRG